MINFVKLGALVGTVFLVSFGPFVILVRCSNYYKGSATLLISCAEFEMFNYFEIRNPVDSSFLVHLHEYVCTQG